MASIENCGSAVEQVEGRNGRGHDGEDSEMCGEKAGKVEGKEEGSEGEEKKCGHLEGVALKKPTKRGRKKKEVTVSSKKCEKETLEEGNVELSSDLVAEKAEESGEKLEENGVQPKGKKRVTFVENLELANGEHGASMQVSADLGAADNGEGNIGDVLKRRLRAIAKKVSYAEVQGDEGFSTKKRGRRGRRKKEALKSEGQEDGNNDNEDNGIPAKKRGRRGRPKRKVSESEDNEGKDGKERGGKEEQGGDLGVDDGKKRMRRGAKKMDREVLENGTSLEKQEEKDSLRLNCKSKYLLRDSRNPKKGEEPVPYSKEQRDKVRNHPFNGCVIIMMISSFWLHGGWKSCCVMFPLAFNSGFVKNQ